MHNAVKVEIRTVLIGVKEGPGGGWSLGIKHNVVQTGDGPLFRFYTFENDSLNRSFIDPIIFLMQQQFIKAVNNKMD